MMVKSSEHSAAGDESTDLGILGYSNRGSEYQPKWWHGSWFDWLGSIGLVFVFGMLVMLGVFVAELIRRSAER
jgi:hypothetical protein